LADMGGFLGKLGSYIHTSMTVYTWTQLGIGFGSALGTSLGYGDNNNAAKLFMGNFCLDENSFFGGIFRGYMRHTPWERFNTLSGHFYTQMRNMNGKVDRVEYNAGVTYAIDEYANGRSVSLGNFSVIKLSGTFTNFDVDDVFWHEFGHTKDSRLFGPLYLPVMGIFSAWKDMRELSGGWTENWAKRYSERYRKRRGIPF